MSAGIDAHKVASKENEFYFHPTPSELVREFVGAMQIEVGAVGIRWESSPLQILDMFCGDGRLGRAAADIFARFVPRVNLTLVDIEMRTNGESHNHIVEKTLDCFHASWAEDSDVVVANPPFKAMARAESELLGFPWPEMAANGRNLYAMGIDRCLEACVPGGLVAVIAPFSWTTGVTFASFRKKLLNVCERIHIVPHPGKAHFDDVHQEIAFQFFWKKNSEKCAKVAAVFFKGDALNLIVGGDKKNDSNKRLSDSFIPKVGPLVWNRTEYELVPYLKNKTTLVIYGGNIFEGVGLKLCFGRYEEKQAIRGNTMSSAEVFTGPGVLLRRTVRGSPGGWFVDSVSVGRRFKAVLENHVVSIRVPSTWTKEKTSEFRQFLVEAIQKEHAPSGAATLNLDEIRRAIDRVLGSAKFAFESNYC